MAMSQLGGRQLAGRLGKRGRRWYSSVEDSWLVVSGKDGGDVACSSVEDSWMVVSGKDGDDVAARWKTSGWSSGKDGGDVAARRKTAGWSSREKMAAVVSLGKAALNDSLNEGDGLVAEIATSLPIAQSKRIE
jgi:hypothetical protein